MLGFVDDDEQTHGTEQSGAPVLGGLEWVVQRAAVVRLDAVSALARPVYVGVIAGSGSEGIMSNIIRTFLGDEDEVLTTVSGIFAASDISVAPRYGSWDSTTFSVVPPEGPGQSPAPSNGPAGS